MNLATSRTKVVGVDISYEVTTYAIVDIRGNIIAEDHFPTIDYPEASAFVVELCRRVAAMAEAHCGLAQIRSIGVSAPSANYRTGCMEHSPNMKWKGVVPLAAMIRDRLGLAVMLANNAYARGLGEYMFGSAHGMSVFVLITLGTGLGSCLFIDGKPYRGADGFAGEIGHICFSPGGRRCGCGASGCLETYTAAKGIVTTARELMAQSDQPSLMRHHDQLTPAVIAACCDQGDEMAIEVFRRTGEALGLGLANYASVISPEAFVLSGGIPKAGHWLLDPLRESFNEHVFYRQQGKVRLLVSSLNDHERDVLGASSLAWEVKEYSLYV